jgi:hypothetical protein
MQIGKPCIVYFVIVIQWSLISNKLKKHLLLLLLLLLAKPVPNYVVPKTH